MSGQLSSGVSQIFTDHRSFTALKQDGSVVTWGGSYSGSDSSSVSSQLISGVSQIFSTSGANAALKEDGSVVTWGLSYRGGDSSSVTAELSSGVIQIFPSALGFAALKNDGSVVAWGEYASTNGSTPGTTSGVSNDLQSGVIRIFTNNYSFAALKEDGSVVTWGWSPFGGDSSSVSSQLSSESSRSFIIASPLLHSKMMAPLFTGGAMCQMILTALVANFPPVSVRFSPRIKHLQRSRRMDPLLLGVILTSVVIAVALATNCNLMWFPLRTHFKMIAWS